MSVLKLYLKQRNISQADKVAADIAAGFGRKPDILRALAITYMRSGLPEKAITILEGKSANGKSDVLNRLLLARFYLDVGKPGRSEKIYKNLLVSMPGNLLVMKGLVQAYIKKKDFDQAGRLLGQIIKKYPGYVSAYLTKGALAERAGDKKNALENYKKAFELQPANLTVLKYVGSLLQKGNILEAKKLLRNRLFAHPNEHNIRVQLAGLYQQNHETKKAIKEYLYLEEAGAYKLVSQNNLFWLFLETGDPRVSAYVQKLVDSKTKAPAILDTIGWGYLQTGKLDKAGYYLKAASEKLKKEPSVQYHMAVYLHKKGKSAEAKKILESILTGQRGFPEKKEARELLGRI